MFRWSARLLILCFLSAMFAAEKPAFEHLFPAGASRGTTNALTLFGKFEPWPPKVWSSIAGLEFQFSTNKGNAQLVIAPDTPVGPVLVRLFNDEGASDLRIFVVADKPETTESEPNSHFAKAQVLTNLPTIVNGRLEKNGDVDSFSFQMKAGEWLDAALDSYTLLAKLDPLLRLVTTNGYQLAWNHDFSSLDPRLVWQAPRDLTVVLQVFGFVYPADADIRLSGGSAGVYRLHLSLLEYLPSDLAEKMTENEPNGSTNNAAPLELASEIVGAVCPAGDVDRFKIVLKKDQQIEARLAAASIGSPLDAWLAIENESGKELARNDDADNSRDPRLDWKASDDGSYFLVVGSVTHQGSADCRYHLSFRSLAADYTLTSSADALLLSTGSTNTLKLNLKRLRGFTNELVAVVKDLPEGVSAEAATLPSKDGEVLISFVGATNSPPFSGPFHVRVGDRQTTEERPVLFELVSRTENNGVPGGYSKLLVESTTDLWLTVRRPELKSAEVKK